MKKLLVLACALFLLLGAHGIAGAATVTFSPNPIPDQTLGSTFGVSIMGQDFPSTAGGNVVVSWDPTILTLTLPADITQTWPGDTWGASDVSAGSINISSGAFGTPVSSGSFGIADLLFSATGVGTSPFTLASNTWVEPDFSTGIPVTDESGSVNVVPIPGSILLLGSGLVGLIGFSRRRRS